LKKNFSPSPIEYLIKPVKYIVDNEIALMFEEKCGSRYKIRNKLDEIVSKYLTEIELLLPISDQKNLCEKLMDLLGFSLLHFHIYVIVSTIHIIVYFSDSAIDYNSKRNTEIMKCDANLENGILDMKRDVNLLLVVFFHSYDDIRAVLISL
jgi:hypothetical protein